MKFIGHKRRWFKPEFIADSVTDIDFRLLKKRGILTAFLDLDGTVVERANYIVAPKITNILRRQPLNIYIATNRPKSRDLKDLRQRLHAQGVIHPKGLVGKPFPGYYKAAIKEIGLKPAGVIMIGDRYIQDILGANAAGLHTLVVKKLDKPTNAFDRLLSAAERKLFEKFAKKYPDAK